ncbi:MAG: rhodanese-like domain-containing protein [Magnetococcales bacterium]|nr:rhodanese-like domain-containing protein [Magnetococcales bacterium]
MFPSSSTGQLPVDELLANPGGYLLVDVRGVSKGEPAIPGSRRVYLLDIEERPEAFLRPFASQLSKRPLLFYCSKGESSYYLLDKFPDRSRLHALQGGMVSYLMTISRLLHEHPYEDQSKRGETMAKILAALTSGETDADTFRKIVDRLLRCTPNPRFKKLVR